MPHLSNWHDPRWTLRNPVTSSKRVHNNMEPQKSGSYRQSQHVHSVMAMLPTSSMLQNSTAKSRPVSFRSAPQHGRRGPISPYRRERGLTQNEQRPRVSNFNQNTAVKGKQNEPTKSDQTVHTNQKAKRKNEPNVFPLSLSPSLTSPDLARELAPNHLQHARRGG